MKKSISIFLAGFVMLLSSCGTSNVKEPEYREIREVRLIEGGLLQSTAGIDMVYYNPNNFGVQVAEARGDVFIDSVFLGRFGLAETVQVNKNSEFVIPAVLKLDMIGLLKNHRDLLKKKEALIRIEGIARIKKAGFSKEIPIRFENMENIERFRSLIGK
jgi:LEA14-like dessication related protein